MDRERARHWLAYGQKWNDEEAAARKGYRRLRVSAPEVSRLG
jgi:hypothetical protein